MPAVAANEFSKRRHHRHLQPFTQAVRWGQLHMRGFFREQHRHHAHRHRHGHGDIGHTPSRILVGARWQAAHFGTGGNPKHTCTRPNHGQAVTGLVAGSQHRLQAGLGRLDAKRIQSNVLGGRAKRCQQSKSHQRCERILRVAPRHAQQTGHDRRLRQQQPTAPSSQQWGQQR